LQPQVQRTNLSMDVKCLGDEYSQEQELIKILRSPEHHTESTVVYVWKKATADILVKKLRNIIKGGVRAYHGGMLPEARRMAQDAFMSGVTRVVIATMAFGMGLDKHDIRTVVHFGLPKSIENYIQETGRCSRDGAPGRCIALVTPKDYKAQRWVTSGAGSALGKAGLARRLLGMLLREGDKGSLTRYNLSQAAADGIVEAVSAKPTFEEAAQTEEARELTEDNQPYYVALEEAEMARTLNCQRDELHSILAHLAHHAGRQVLLFSSFPTKMKLRFFRSDPVHLAQQNSLLRQILELTKKTAGVYTFETARALAELGGRQRQLSDVLWQMQGREFSVEKDGWGHMLLVMGKVTEATIQDWADKICNINTRAREASLQRIDAAYIALTRGAEASAAAASAAEAADRQGSAGDGKHFDMPTAHMVLNDLINAYFKATVNPSAVVAGNDKERQRRLFAVIGRELQQAPTGATRPQEIGGQRISGQGQPEAVDFTISEDDRRQAEASAVYSVAARLVLSPEWPSVPTDEPEAVAHAVAQFLAGIGSMVFPAAKWRQHRCWGRFKEFGDFEHLEELVSSALTRLRALQAAKRK